jgi:endonuclease/exonuclease/phosphatase (EEP) superfamily protein YafD
MVTTIIIYQILMCLFAFITLIKIEHWVVRLFDFPKVQLLVLSLLGLFFGLFYFSFESILQWVGVVMVTLAINFHCIKIIPYTVFFKKEVIRTVPTDSSICLSLLTSNVLMPNQDYEKLLSRIDTYQTDV